MKIRRLCITTLCLSGLTSLAFADNAVQSVSFRPAEHSSSIIVLNNGSTYSSLTTASLSIPVQFSASCSAGTELSSLRIGLGKFNILSGHMDEDQKIFFEKVAVHAGSRSLSWQTRNFRFNIERIPFGPNTGPVKACNAFMQQKSRQGISQQVFMQQDRRMKVNFELSVAAECKRKWKHAGQWKQQTAAVHAVVICKAR